jgi:hypothetical protein
MAALANNESEFHKQILCPRTSHGSLQGQQDISVDRSSMDSDVSSMDGSYPDSQPHREAQVPRWTGVDTVLGVTTGVCE